MTEQTSYQSQALKQIEEQLSLPPEEQRALIRSEAPLSDLGVRLAVLAARQFGLPLQGINIFPNARGQLQVFVNSDGIRWRLQLDPRRLARSTGQILHVPSPQEPWIQARAQISFVDSSTYSNEAWCWLRYDPEHDEWLERSRLGRWNPVALGDRLMAMITKAKRRAGLDAIGVALPIFEDYLESAQVPAEEPDLEDLGPAPIQRPQVPPRTLEQLALELKKRGLTLASLAQKMELRLERLAQEPELAWDYLASQEEEILSSEGVENEAL